MPLELSKVKPCPECKGWMQGDRCDCGYQKLRELSTAEMIADQIRRGYLAD